MALIAEKLAVVFDRRAYRVTYVDMLRGLIIVVMAVDHSQAGSEGARWSRRAQAPGTQSRGALQAGGMLKLSRKRFVGS
jgi:uncharacterized membrane protein